MSPNSSSKAPLGKAPLGKALSGKALSGGALSGEAPSGEALSGGAPSGSPLRVAIVGGGISGLSAAYYIEQLTATEGVSCSIELFEARERLGGVILTERCGDFLIEGGPDSFLTQKPAAIELCRELGLADDLIPSQDQQRKTYVLHRGSLEPLPDGLFFVVPTRVWPLLSGPLLSPAGKFRLALSPFLPPLKPLARMAGDVSVADFISRRFGREVLERLAEPLLAAVYGADVETLSARAALPQLVALEEKYGGLWRGLPHARPASKEKRPAIFTTLRGGTGELIAALEARLSRTRITRGASVRTIQRNPQDGCFYIELENVAAAQAGLQDRQIAVDAAVIAVPAPAAARLLHNLDPSLSGQLAEIPYNSSVMVALAFPQDAFAGNVQGFGYVVPRGEGEEVIACTWSSVKFPFRSPGDGVLLRCFLGGARQPDILQWSDERMVNAVQRQLEHLFHTQRPSLFTRVYRWEHCMPQYTVGHSVRVREIEASLARHSGLFLAGNGYWGVGISDCIQSAARAAADISKMRAV